MELLTWLDPGPDAGLGAVFVASLLAATLLPGGSELVFAGFVALHPGQWLPALLLATLGNTAGGMSSYALGRLAPRKELTPQLGWVRRWGAVTLGLAWAPLIGDALCLAAGVLRLDWRACLLWMAAGKALRYAALLAVVPAAG